MSGPPPIERAPSDVDAARASVVTVRDLLERTIQRSSSFTETELKQGVNDEWSTVESLQHIVFVIDVWLGRTIKGEQDPFHPVGLPPHFVPRVLPGSSINSDADPSFDEACDVMRDRIAMLASFCDALTPYELGREIGTHAKDVAGGLGVIFDELHAHNYFINRDLDVIEKATGGARSATPSDDGRART